MGGYYNASSKSGMRKHGLNLSGSKYTWRVLLNAEMNIQVP
jgi:hypothetical protein